MRAISSDLNKDTAAWKICTTCKEKEKLWAMPIYVLQNTQCSLKLKFQSTGLFVNEQHVKSHHSVYDYGTLLSFIIVKTIKHGSENYRTHVEIAVQAN